MHNALLLCGACIPIISTVIYVRSIVRGETKPHRVTYGLFVAITGLVLGSLAAGRDTSGVWLALAAFVQVAIIFALSVKFGMGGKEPFDITCTVLCSMGVILWLATGESLIGLFAGITADFLALLPAMRKMWRYPHTETWVFYAIDVLASVSILAAGPYGWRAFLYPLYLGLVNSACAVIIVHRRSIAMRLPSR
jgi:hypothetical protein